MKIANIDKAESWFQVLATTKQSQIAVLTLEADGESSEEMNTHKKSDQTILIVEGEIRAEVGDKERVLVKGDSRIIPAGTPHRLTNAGLKKAVTFHVYSPREYSSDKKS